MEVRRGRTTARPEPDDGDTDARATIRIPTLARSRSRPALPATTSGGEYSLTKPARPRRGTTRAPETTAVPPTPTTSEVQALPTGGIRLALGGRAIILTRRDARLLADRLLRALK